jgi:hypothetical protein
MLDRLRQFAALETVDGKPEEGGGKSRKGPLLRDAVRGREGPKLHMDHTFVFI